MTGCSISAPSTVARRSSPTRGASRPTAPTRSTRQWPNTPTMVSAQRDGAASASMLVEDLRCPCCAEDVLGTVRALAGVRAAEFDYQRGELEVAYDATLIDDEAVRRAVRERGYRCVGDRGGATTGQL